MNLINKEMSFKKQFREELIKEDAWISLTNEQRESVVNMGEQQLQLYLVSQQRELLKAYAELVQSSYTTHFFDDAIEESIDEFLSI